VQSPLGWRWVLLGRRWVLEWDLPSLEQQCLGKRWGIQEPQWGQRRGYRAPMLGQL
jgi:hypothetical protein